MQEVAAQTDNHVLVVRIENAAHAINFSHPGELSNVIRLFMDDKPIVDDPDSPGQASVYEIHRGTHHPPAQDGLGPRQHGAESLGQHDVLRAIPGTAAPPGRACSRRCRIRSR